MVALDSRVREEEVAAKQEGEGEGEVGERH